MSVDLCLVDGFGICLEELDWKEEVNYSDMEAFIDENLCVDLLYAPMNDSHYIYAPTIFPTQADVAGSKIWTREELGHEIYELLKDFVDDTEDEIAVQLCHVFDWETC